MQVTTAVDLSKRKLTLHISWAGETNVSSRSRRVGKSHWSWVSGLFSVIAFATGLRLKHIKLFEPGGDLRHAPNTGVLWSLTTQARNLFHSLNYHHPSPYWDTKSALRAGEITVNQWNLVSVPLVEWIHSKSACASAMFTLEQISWSIFILTETGA